MVKSKTSIRSNFHPYLKIDTSQDWHNSALRPHASTYKSILSLENLGDILRHLSGDMKLRHWVIGSRPFETNTCLEKSGKVNE
jgi:hypothetical protein